MYKLNTLPLFPPTIIGLDIETTGLDPFGDQILLIGISDGYNSWILTENFERIIPIVEDNNCTKVIQNALFDLSFLCAKFSCKPKNIWDTMLIEQLLWNGKDADCALDDIIARRLGILIDKSVRESFIGHTGDISQEQLEYLENDVKYLLSIRKSQLEDVSATGMGKVASLENHTVLPVMDMYLTGVGFDLELWKDVRKEVVETVHRLEKDMIVCLGYDFTVEVDAVKKGVPYIKYINVTDINWASVDQLRGVLKKLGIKTKLSKRPKNSKSKKPLGMSTGREALEEVVDKHPFIQILLDYKKWDKLATWDWDESINPITGRIHPDWKQLGPETGRFACGEPNMQQIPRPAPGYPNMRKLFMGLPGHVLITADYSQQEPRILAGVSGDPAMLKAAQESDIYSAFAREIYKKEVTKKDPERQLTKTGVLATAYGSYPKGLAPKLGVSYEETKEFQNKVHRAYPLAMRWGTSQLSVVRQCGFSKTLIGRRRYFPELKTTNKEDLWRFDNTLRNNPIQGTGADATKLALWKIYKLINEGNYEAHIIMTIHDEIVVSVRKDQAEELFPKVIEAMETAASDVCPGVKFIAEGKISDVWEH